MKDDNKKFWERFARLYSPFMEKGNRKLYEQICARIRPQLNRQMKVLELACGSGQLSFRLASAVQLWEATDFSEAMIHEAKKQKPSGRLHFSVQDATSLPYGAESFDAVVIANALHIMPHPEQALAEIRRVLKVDGILFAPTFIHGRGTGFRLRSRMLELAGFRVYSRWSEKEFADYVCSHGFTVRKCECLGKSIAPFCYLEAEQEK